MLKQLLDIVTLAALCAVMIIVLSACDNPPVTTCNPDGCYINGFPIDSNNNYIKE